MPDRLVFGSEEANRIARGERPKSRCRVNVNDDAPKVRTPMTDREKYATRCLWACTLRIGSYNKRFARAMHAITGSDNAATTDAQRDNLWRLVYRYRRQIRDDDLVAEARAKVGEINERDMIGHADGGRGGLDDRPPGRVGPRFVLRARVEVRRSLLQAIADHASDQAAHSLVCTKVDGRFGGDGRREGHGDASGWGPVA